MNYFLFLNKKIIKNKMNWIPIIILIGVLTSILFLNNRTAEKMSLKNQIQDNIASNALNVQKSKENLELMAKDSEAYSLLEKNIEESEKLIKQDKEFLTSYKKENWKAVYAQQIKNITTAIKSIEKNSPDLLLLKALDRDLKMYKELSNTNISFEDSDFPTTGLQYTLSMFRYVFPILFTIGIIFIFSNLYGSSYYENINKDLLLPRNLRTISLKSIVTGVITSVSLLIVLTFFTYCISAIFFGTGNLSYPILNYDLISKEPYFNKISVTIFPVAVLQILTTVFVVCLVYLIASLCKDKLTTLFISILLLIGGFLLPNFIQPLQSVAQYIPTTYMKSFDIVTGVFQESIDNYKISFVSGLLVLGISITIIMSIILLIQRRRNTLSWL